MNLSINEILIISFVSYVRLTLHQDEGREMKRVIKHQQGLMDQLETQFNMRYTFTPGIYFNAMKQ